MKGYNVEAGYMGYVLSEGKYMLFESESAYVEWFLDSMETE